MIMLLLSSLLFFTQHIPLLMCSALKVNRVFHIPPEPFDLMAENGELVSISPPCSWSGLAPVQVRLLSYEWREGQVQYIWYKYPVLCQNTIARFKEYCRLLGRLHWESIVLFVVSRFGHNCPQLYFYWDCYNTDSLQNKELQEKLCMQKIWANFITGRKQD